MSTRRTRSAEKRFWSKVDTSGECWEWTGAKTNGYGIFGVAGRNVRTHRFSYELHVGAIPDTLMVCHTCDNRACVRPDHLFLGTAKDNVQDCISKGRFHTNAPPRRPRNAERWDQAISLYIKEVPIRHIADRLSISPKAVRYILQSSGVYCASRARRHNPAWEEASSLFKSGTPKRQIARQVGMTPKAVRYLLRRQGLT